LRPIRDRCRRDDVPIARAHGAALPGDDTAQAIIRMAAPLMAANAISMNTHTVSVAPHQVHQASKKPKPVRKNRRCTLQQPVGMRLRRLAVESK